MNMSASQPTPKKGYDAVAVQVAALCWRLRKGLVEVLLITSRETGRWVLPKGWPVGGLTAAEAAAREAWEEAGVRGRVQDQPLGEFHYEKVTPAEQANKRCAVTVFGMKVDALKNHFPEAAQRQRKWFAAEEAADLVAEPDLRALLTGVADFPDRLRRGNPVAPA